MSAYLSSEQGLITRLELAQKVVSGQPHRGTSLGLDGAVIDSHLASLLRIGGSEQRSIIVPARLKPRARLHNCDDRRAWRQFEGVHQKGVLGAEVGRRHRCVGGHVIAGA